MSNRLEQFIRDNREEFDSEEPRPQLWDKLVKDMPQKKDDRVLHLGFLRFSAAAAIVIMLAGMFYYMNQQKSTDGLTKNSDPTSEEQWLSDVNPTYAKEVYHFTQLIELKQQELKQIEREQPELYGQFVKDIHKLDSSYQALRQALPATPDRATLLEAMIQNLRLQADLLNQQLTIIKQIKQSKKDSHEKDTRSA
jgi:hypothetical protein